jgi:magnesium-transporting ATPase (P-type)
MSEIVSTCMWIFCNNRVPGKVDKCPKCGRKMRSGGFIRGLGWVLLLIGLFLVGLMGTITVNVGWGMLHPGETVQGSTFTGTAEQGKLFLTLFGLVIIFGLGSIFNGLYQIITGQRNRIVLFVMLGLAAVLFLYAYVLNHTLPG